MEIPKIFDKTGGGIGKTVERVVNSKINEIHTTTIGIIQSFNAETQMAIIQPAIKRIITTENRNSIIYSYENYPLLVNVPVIFPGGGDWFMTFPISGGDECLIFSMERSIGNWKEDGGLQEPSSYRRKLSFKDAIAMVGLNSKASSLPNFNASEPELRNRDGDVKLTMGASGVTLTGDLVVTGSIDVAGGNFTVEV